MTRMAIWLAAVAGLAAVGLIALAVTGWMAADDENRGETETPTEAPAVAAPVTSGDALIAVVDNAFEPDRLNVTPGTTVTWEWEGENPHRIVGTVPGDLDSGEKTTGTYEFTFDEEGQWEFHCSVHGPEAMGGVVIVVAEAAEE